MQERFIKLTSAVYNILEFFPDGEPLKNRAKDKALMILEKLALVYGTQGWASMQKEKVQSELLDDIEVLLSYLKVAKLKGWIENVNFLIIFQEYEEIKNKLGLSTRLIQIASLKPNDANTLSARQSRILGLLQEKGKVQVSDIIKILPDITKRTIRRDLDELLKTGRITRSGEFNRICYALSEYKDKSGGTVQMS